MVFKEVRAGRNSIGEGIGIGVFFHLCQAAILVVLSFVVPGFSFIALVGWGVTQLFYMAPAIVIACRAGKNETAKGLILVAAIGFLLNGACDAYFAYVLMAMRKVQLRH